MTDWLEAEKSIANTLLTRMEAQFSQGKPFIINYDSSLMPSKFYYPGYPCKLLYFFQVVHFGIMTSESLNFFENSLENPIGSCKEK
jgi:hypothetical protein